MSIVVRKDEPLKPYTTFGIGGIAEYFVEVSSVNEVREAGVWARERGLSTTIIAGGSNVVCAERVFGLVVRVAIRGLTVAGHHLRVGAGESLMETVHAANEAGRSGLETLAGIPGTVGGAIVGNAGAYGAEVGSRVAGIEALDGERIIVMSREACDFSYRDSIFKRRRDMIVLAVIFELTPGDARELKKKSAEIIRKREQKYSSDMRCPGSFFKNILFSDLTIEQKERIDPEKVIAGKVPAGYLLERVGACGRRRGGVSVALHHGNLIMSDGSATVDHVRELADELKRDVRNFFGIELTEEIQYIS